MPVHNVPHKTNLPKIENFVESQFDFYFDEVIIIKGYNRYGGNLLRQTIRLFAQDSDEIEQFLLLNEFTKVNFINCNESIPFTKSYTRSYNSDLGFHTDEVYIEVNLVEDINLTVKSIYLLNSFWRENKNSNIDKTNLCALTYYILKKIPDMKDNIKK